MPFPDQNYETHSIQPGQSVEVTLLNPALGPIFGSVVDVSGPQLRVHLDEEVPFGAAVKVECGAGILVLGDVCHCEAHQDGFQVGITARHRLDVLQQLNQLAEHLRINNKEVRAEVSPGNG